ncbi:MAG: tol-pal system protein YbgF [Gammaproteobacteria bacterium]|nr:tol-pal system protein YbgF [Gammaproteobacteria bacterium]MDH5692176.1 tol-pal system protein YbgF [Gammaproteobacteria bacterium]
MFRLRAPDLMEGQNRLRVLAFSLFFLLLVVGSAQAAKLDTKDMTVDQRLSRLENQSGNQNLVEMFLTVERLQQELSTLRGQIDVLTHQLKAMNEQQKDLYLDLDTRIQQLSSSGALGSGQANSNSLNMDGLSGQLAEQTEYQSAFAFLKEAKYPEAIAAFEQFLSHYPQGTYAANAQYWIGEANYVSKDYAKAVPAFSNVISSYPKSNKVQDAELKLGFSYYELENWAKAKKTLQGVMVKYPNSSVARLADKRLQQMRLENH